MKKRSTTTVILLPHIYFLLLSLMDFIGSNLFDVKGLIVLSLMIVNPVVFAIQGVFSAKYSVEFYISVGLFLMSYMTFACVTLNESAFGYVIFYLIIGVFSYRLGKKFK